MPKKAAAVQLKSLKYRNRMIWINGDPYLNHLLPLDNGWRVNDLADEIMRACVDYDVNAEWDAARSLALSIMKQVCKDTIQNGVPSLGWD